MRAARPARVLVLKGVCNYDHIRCFADYLRMGFDREGCETAVFDFGRGMPDLPTFENLRAFGADAVISFNTAGAGVVGPDGAGFGGPKVPLTTWMVDEPYYHPVWQKALRVPNLLTRWTNHETRAHAEAMGLPDPRTLLLAGRSLPRTRPEDRDIEVLFVGTGSDPDRMRAGWKVRLGPAMCRLMDTLVEVWGAKPSKRPIREVFRELTEASGIAGHDGLVQITPMILGEVNRYVRARKRLDFLRAMRELPLTLVGDGWRGLVDGPRIEHRASVPFHVCEEMVSRAKVTLALQPIHAHGASERFFSVLANESALVVNDNTWLEQHYVRGEEYESFQDERPEQAVAVVERLLRDEPARWSMVQAARQRTVDAHTWRHRARTLLDGWGLGPGVPLARPASAASAPPA